MIIVDLFSGIGSFSMAARKVWPGCEIAAMCEIDKHCREYLADEWPGVTIHRDIKDVDWSRYEAVDLVCGGPPCQPISVAGKRKGAADDRWLWGEALQVVASTRPRWCLFENPPGIRTMGLDGILTTLEGLGYTTGTVDIPACAVNSPQRRHRYFILANRNDPGRQGRGGLEQADPGREAETARGHDSAGYADGRVACSESKRTKPGGRNSSAVQKWNKLQTDANAGRTEVRQGAYGCNGSDGQWDSHVWLPCADKQVRRAPDLAELLVDGATVDIIDKLAEEGWPHRSVLAALGNAVVWQVAVEIMWAMKAADENTTVVWADKNEGPTR